MHLKMCASTSARYVLVYLQKANETSTSPANFTDSVLGTLCGGKDVGSVYAQVKKDRLTVSQSPLVPGDVAVRIKRPTFCPIHNISPDQIKSLHEDIVNRGINSGAATLLETSDEKLLLTRRAYHMRTFPGVWVPPGGHIEYDESFSEAALREMKEEVGLDLSRADFQSIQQLALWESVFPTKLCIALPKRHHVVCYIHAKLKPPHTAESLSTRIKLDPTEVGACAWVDRQMVEAIVAASEEDTQRNEELNKALPKTFRATVINKEGQIHEEMIDTTVLTNICPGEQTDIERVSTGTKFAMSEWLASK